MGSRGGFPRTRPRVEHNGGNSKSSLGWLRCGQAHRPPQGPSSSRRLFLFLLQLPQQQPEMGSPPFLETLLPLALRAFFHKQPRPSISVLRVSGPWRGHADFEEVKGAGVRPSSNKWVAVRGGPLLFFPGLRRGACQEDGEASRPPAAPCGEADRRWQLCGARVPGPCLLSAEGPLCPSPSPS